MSSIDVLQARRETPGCAEVLHFNNAGAALMPRPVLDAVRGHLDLEATIGGYEAAAAARERLEDLYTAGAGLLGCQPGEIAFVENATRAWDMAFYSLPLGKGDRVLTTRAEYASNYIALLQVTRRTGARLEIIPEDEHGRLSIPALGEMLDRKVKVVSVTHVPTNGGVIHPAAEVGRLLGETREPRPVYILDACQSVGQMPVKVDETGCDILTATGRKYLRGPRGTGLLYVRRGLMEELEPPFLDLRAARWISPEDYEMRPDARRFECWESFVAGRLGLAAAIRYALGLGLDAIRTRIHMLAESLRDGLSGIPGATVMDLGLDRCGIISFTLAGQDPRDVRSLLREMRINVSVSPYDSTLLDAEARGLDDMLRASVHCYNTEEEVDRFCEALKELP